jgi:hypothetical protein
VQVKQFLIQFEYNDTTRWLEDDAKLAQWVASVAAESVKFRTEGLFPLTTVHLVEKPQGGRQGQLVVLKLKEAVTK